MLRTTLSGLVIQLVRALSPYLCRAVRYKFESRPTHYFLPSLDLVASLP